MTTPYIFPSENGLRMETRELNYGRLKVRAMGQSFAFNLSPYSQNQLAKRDIGIYLKKKQEHG